MARACGRIMLEQKQGKIVNIASLHTHESLAGVARDALQQAILNLLGNALAVHIVKHRAFAFAARAALRVCVARH
jgi:NAD(P)-dependent dehydrogenase (short-subunit alcohol dehydrogenase family)